MRIGLLTTGDVGRDPRFRSLARSLHRVGHDVLTVDGGTGSVRWPGLAIRVPSRIPTWRGPVGSRLRSIQPPSFREATYRKRLGSAIGGADPDLIYPSSPTALHIALEATPSSTLVSSPPAWGEPEIRDIALIAPLEPRWSSSPAGEGLPHHLPGWHGVDGIEPGRARGTTIVAAYRQTPTTPGRYLTAALERAGVEVIRVGTDLDWDEVPDHAAAVVIVESPLPALDVRGVRKPIPVLFWVHHGEHHLDTNLRLIDRYGVDGVLLAHSWHLAHRFPVPVHRFPFAVAPELYPAPVGFEARHWDVAMVGAGLHQRGGRYDRRYALASSLRSAFGDRALFPERVTPEELATIYSQARVVVNEGGDRHRPITMRVFEALGAGAALLSDDLPGMSVLLDRDREYTVLGDDVVGQVLTLCRNGATLAVAGQSKARSVHTYDHRVNELLAIIPQSSTHTDRHSARASVLDPDVDSIVVGLDPEQAEEEHGDRVVWSVESLGDRAVDAALITGSERLDDTVTMIRRARRFVYVTGGRDLTDAVLEHHPEANRSEVGAGAVRYDLRPGTGYRLADSAP